MDAVPKEYSESCVKVMDYLYVGDRKAAKSKSLLEKLGITEIINVTIPRNQGGVHNFFEADERFNYLRCPCVDSDVEDISRYFLQSIQFIDEARSKGHSVLIHCQLGQSRSVTIALAYMISTGDWTLTTAYTHLKTIRPRVKPKSNFLRQLIKFQTEINVKDEKEGSKEEGSGEKVEEQVEGQVEEGSVEVVEEKKEAPTQEGPSSESPEDEDDDLGIQRKNSKKRTLEIDDSQSESAKKRLKIAESEKDVISTKLSVNGKQSRVFGMALPPHLVNQT